MEANQKSTSPQSINTFIHTQGITAGLINMLVNPTVAWLCNRKMEFVPLFTGSSIVIDTIITSLALSLLVALFTSSGCRKAFNMGLVEIPGNMGRLFLPLPDKAWAAGLTIGFCAALVMVPLIIGIFHLLGISGLPFWGFAIYKSIYTPLLAYFTVYCIVMRESNGRVK